MLFVNRDVERFTQNIVDTCIKTLQRFGSRSNRLLPDACHSGTCSHLLVRRFVKLRDVSVTTHTACLGGSKGRLVDSCSLVGDGKDWQTD